MRFDETHVVGNNGWSTRSPYCIEFKKNFMNDEKECIGVAFIKYYASSNRKYILSVLLFQKRIRINWLPGRFFNHLPDIYHDLLHTTCEQVAYYLSHKY